MTVEPRPLELRQLDALKDWLDSPLWTIREAACLLAGVLPSERLGDLRPFGAWLPGNEPWEVGMEAWNQIMAAKVSHIETILRDDKRVSGHTPKAFLLLASRLKVIPPWTQAVLDSQRHAETLSAPLRAALKEAIGKTNEENRAAYRSFGARAKNWDAAVVRAVDLHGKGISPPKIAEILAKEGYCWDRKETKTFEPATLRRWFREMEGDPQNGLPAQSALEYTAAFRRWRDGVNR